MKIKISSVGKIKQRFVLDGEHEYLSRFPGTCRISVQELVSSHSKGSSPEEVKRKEADLLLSKVDRGDFLVALDENGKSFSSELFAEWMQDKLTHGRSSFHFVIGGAFGFDEQIHRRANLVLSLSQFTFPYQLTRLILVEQLYRAVSIISGSPYHKS